MQENNLLELTGGVEDVVYRNDKNGYTVLRISAQGEEITAIGTMPDVNVGENVQLLGNWKEHPSFGLQFSTKCYQRKMPSGCEAIVKYLSSGVIRGVGDATAKKIVDAFGEETLQVIQQEPHKLSRIRGISRAKAKEISEQVKNLFGVQELINYLAQFNISPQESVTIWKALGADASHKINEDPYCICEEPINVDFDKADLISQSMQRENDDFYRIRAALSYILRHNMKNGHTCLPQDKTIQATAKFLETSVSQIEDAVARIKLENSLAFYEMDEKTFVSTNEMFECESFIASRLRIMLRYPPKKIQNVEGEIAQIEKSANIEYAQLQKQSITEALQRGVLVLTGGPGTGKTTTLNAIIHILERSGGKVFLAAPTGRAAKRMSEVTGREAKTIHRLLEVVWSEENELYFQKNEKNLLRCDTLIIDELSMVDAKLFEAVLHAVPLGCRLILVGDCNQLPSIGAGNILSDLISSDILPVVQLKEIFRQAKESLLVMNAHRVINGEMPVLTAKDNDFFFMAQNKPYTIEETVLQLYSKRLPAAYGYSPMADIQVLCPGKRGRLGTIELNSQLQNALNPAMVGKNEISINSITFRENDKVMQTKNNYNITWYKADDTTGEGIFNGDIGILRRIDLEAATLSVQYDDKIAVYNIEAAADLDLAYAITIHKSQGSEFEAVIMPMFDCAQPLCYRNLLYTGMTRAKSIIIMVGKSEMIAKMAANDRKTKRYSSLCHFLREENNA